MIDVNKGNRLVHSTSPYLLQHAFNPVDWYEWGEEALARAKKENKPILVSIGYSSCHWCHVMEREVFENEEIARLMNTYFVCIKVDREERPDIDQIYMDAVQAMGMQGGWPLNVFLTPDQKPFYGGTYFPPDQWTRAIQGIQDAFTGRRDEIEESAEQLTQHLISQDVSRFRKDPVPTDLRAQFDDMYGKLEASFDKAWGGLAKAPKFIMPSLWRWMLRYHRLSGRRDVLEHAVFTLRKIAMGGIYDQLGGGFARYSVDQYWFVPHFEKMLYDNAQLLTLYAEAYALTGDREFERVIRETFTWLQAEMMHPDGGFYSALDADSEGEEGKFYHWPASELREILGDDADVFFDYYSIKEEGNWEPDKNIPIRVQKEDDFLKKHNLSEEEWYPRLARLKERLLAVRDKRVRPGLDDKVITGWNAMTVIGLVDAYKALGDEAFLKAALRNMRFIENELTEGLVHYRSWKGKRTHVRAFLDDYAYVIQACVALYHVTLDEYWALRAKALTEHTIEHFFDTKDGYFHFSDLNAEKLIATRQEVLDNVIPSSNSVMAQNLLHLSIVFDYPEWREIAEHMVSPLEHLIVSEPNYMSNWGIVMAEMKKGMAEVVIVGDDAAALARDMYAGFQPFILTMGGDKESQLPLVADKKTLDGNATIYVCYNKTCQRPVLTVEEARELLE